MKFSIIVPVYNRPAEAGELLESLSRQSFTDFEVVMVDDGSTETCEEVCRQYASKMPVRYFFKPNSGPGATRNYAAEKSQGEYLIILDSDVVLPETYLQVTAEELSHKDSDAFGGPDSAHESFTDMQKAISYSMTSFFTTGGIRGGKKKLDKFYPRSFNLGCKAEVFKALGGFSDMRFGEDIDFSIRVFKNNYSCRLFPESWVWHKRRTDLKKFFKQVYNSGIARINLYKKYPESLKVVHLLPMFFTLGTLACITASLLCLVIAFYIYSVYIMRDNSGMLYEMMGTYGVMRYLGLAAIAISPLVLYSLLLCADSSVRNKSLKIGIYSIAAAFTQLVGYGLGFIHAWWGRCVLGKGELEAFKNTFYK